MQNIDFATLEKSALQDLMVQNKIKCHAHLSTTFIRNLSINTSTPKRIQTIAEDIGIQQGKIVPIYISENNSLRRA